MKSHLVNDDQPSQHVYFIAAFESRRIKIGIAADPDARLAQLQVASPEPLAVVAVRRNAGREVERSLHERLGSSRSHGEWFHPTDDVLAAVFHSEQLPPLGWLQRQMLVLDSGNERVAARAATADDLESFAVEERRAAAAGFVRRNRSCEAAEWMAQEMRRQGVTFAADLRLGEDAA